MKVRVAGACVSTAESSPYSTNFTKEFCWKTRKLSKKPGEKSCARNAKEPWK